MVSLMKLDVIRFLFTHVASFECFSIFIDKYSVNLGPFIHVCEACSCVAALDCIVGSLFHLSFLLWLLCSISLKSCCMFDFLSKIPSSVSIILICELFNL